DYYCYSGDDNNHGLF
nr:immunoglobulin light chain junction region [Macaca mulatta]MOW66576.1 immunoglobulin light chain junction region [Macaca mulatta]MOW67161.1 immunoglobulin light chain junction region [Macaca mulatta]MOW67253.1 immunoglobulin light chain junction region [Macaca mulatta]MOW67641.1 immunoglobulin light chain junction region [Macaca mulatta]